MVESNHTRVQHSLSQLHFFVTASLILGLNAYWILSTQGGKMDIWAKLKWTEYMMCLCNILHLHNLIQSGCNLDQFDAIEREC